VTSQAPVASWTTPYSYSVLTVSMVVFAAFTLWEIRCTKPPVLPMSIFKAPTFAAMIVAAFLTFISVGIIIWYIKLINFTIRRYTIFSDAANFANLAVCGACAAILSAVCVRVLPAQAIMVIRSVASGVALTLAAISPTHQTYGPSSLRL
jgi:hypothetical protein